MCKAKQGTQRIQPMAVGILIFFASLNAAGQTSSDRFVFEVASVKLTAHGRGPDGWSFSDIKIVSPGRLVGTNASLDECIRWAYRVKEYQVSGPDWMKSDEASYDIEAKALPETSADGMRLMLQTLLAERFGLVLHRETRRLRVYSLTANKSGSKLLKASSAARGGFNSRGGREGVRVTSHKASLADLASRLSLDLDRPVFDNTGIKGDFEITLEWAREGDGPSVFSAIQEQLGLKLQPTTTPIEIIVIDRANKIPVAN
jgi:uncharacterized protein (TIGR03435 family)